MLKPSLTRSLEKLAQAGEYAGFTVEQMIQFLNAGFTVEDLLYVIEWRLQQISESSDAETPAWIM